jgi:hypothetical protein
MNAANAVNVKQRELIDFNAFENSSFKHRNISQINRRGKNFEAATGAD